MSYITATQAFNNHQQGIVPLTKANLAKYTGPLATTAFAHHGPAEVDRVRAGATSLGFELPVQAEQDILQKYRQPMPMQRYRQENQGRASRGVSQQDWSTLAEQDPLAAELELISKHRYDGYGTKVL